MKWSEWEAMKQGGGWIVPGRGRMAMASIVALLPIESLPLLGLDLLSWVHVEFHQQY